MQNRTQRFTTIVIYFIVICTSLSNICKTRALTEDSRVTLAKDFQSYELKWEPYTLWNFSNKLLNQYCVEPHCLRYAS